MQRSQSSVVLLSVGTLLSGHAAAEAPASASAPAAPAAQVAATAPPKAAPATKPAGDSVVARRPEERLSDEAELARIIGLYEAGKYRECSSELDRLLDPTARTPLRQPSIVENARVYWSACLLGAGEGDAADAPLRAAIHENPQMKPPDSLVFPQPVVQRFLKVRDSLVNEIRAAEQARIKQAQAEARQREERLARERRRMRELEQLAQQEFVVVQNRRVLSFVPFGVGQLQNRQETLGYALMVGEVLLGSLSIAAVAVQSRLAVATDEARRQGLAPRPDELQPFFARQGTWSAIKTVSFWSFATLAVGGVVQAQLEYQPEFREVRTRPLPGTLTPSAPPAETTASPGAEVSALPYFDERGGGLSVVGRF